MTDSGWLIIESLLQQLVDMQQRKLLACGRQMIPSLTADDILQPNDFPVLEQSPLFRYEEGALAGIYTAQMALRALQRDEDACFKNE
jgi:hypothetical protein